MVINHTLLFMLLGDAGEQGERESGYLFPNDFIILDEAHTVEQIASRQIGIGVSQYGLRSTIQRLYNARTRKGLFTVMRDAAGVRLAAELVDEVDRFFAALESTCDFRKGREFRVRAPEIVPDTITGRLTALQARVAEVVKRADDEFLKAELQELGRRIREARDGIAVFLEQSASRTRLLGRADRQDSAISHTKCRADRYRAGVAPNDFSRGLLLCNDKRDALGWSH